MSVSLMVSAVADWAGAIGRTPAAGEHVSAFSIVFATHPARVSPRARISGGRPFAFGPLIPAFVGGRGVLSGL